MPTNISELVGLAPSSIGREPQQPNICEDHRDIFRPTESACVRLLRAPAAESGLCRGRPLIAKLHT